MQKSFWEEYHQKSSLSGQSHEWFVEPEQCMEVLLRGTLQTICKARPWRDQERKALHLGCGTSTLGIEVARQPLCLAAELQVVNVDFSSTAIEAMQQMQGTDVGSMRNQWIVADIREMPFHSSSFDCVIDKGTFDAFEAAGHQPSHEPGILVDAIGLLCNEVDRVLKRHIDAVWLQFTHTAPELRMEVLDRVLPGEGWHVSCNSLGEDSNGFEYFAYFIRRRPRFELLRQNDKAAVQVHLFVDQAEADAACAYLSGTSAKSKCEYVKCKL